MPDYRLRPSYRVKTIKHKFTTAITSFIEEDIGGFAADAFGVSVETDKIKFESVYRGVRKYTNFVLVPPMKGQPASKIND